MMKSIGVTGGVGAGKSAVLKYMKEKHGAHVLLADELAKKLEQPGAVCYEPLINTFGSGILNANGQIDTKAFAAIIFSDDDKLTQANAIIHPAVKDEVIKQLDTKTREGCPVFVLEAALLIEERYDEILDELWYVYADAPKRMERLMSSRGYSREKCIRIMSTQKSDIEFRKYCNKIIDNSGDLWETEAQLDALLL